ncbi:MAG: hypothetical protein WKF58_02570 [Ilumatobacteraceae bacterium]
MIRRAALFIGSLLVVAAVWELYKALGPEDGGAVLGWNILPRTKDTAMPHVWDMVSRLFDPESSGQGLAHLASRARRRVVLAAGGVRRVR